MYEIYFLKKKCLYPRVIQPKILKPNKDRNVINHAYSSYHGFLSGINRKLGNSLSMEAKHSIKIIINSISTVVSQ